MPCAFQALFATLPPLAYVTALFVLLGFVFAIIGACSAIFFCRKILLFPDLCLCSFKTNTEDLKKFLKQCNVVITKNFMLKEL